MSKTAVAILVFALLVGRVVALEVTYIGEPPESKRQIERLARQPINDSTLVDSIKTLLTGAGHLDARVYLADGRLAVRSGPAYRIQTLHFSGDSTFTVEVGEVFDRRRFQATIDGALENLSEDGYIFSAARVQAFRREGNQVRVELHLTRGPLVVLGETVYAGLTRTRTAVVNRYIPLQCGQPLTTRNLQQVERAAATIPFVSFRPPVKIRPRPGYTTADLEFEFAEKRQFHLQGGGGYVPDADAGLVWSLDMAFTNLFGRGREVTILSERRERDRNVLDLGYSQPLFLLGLGTLKLELLTRDYRQQFYEFAVSGAYTMRLNANLSTGLNLGYKTVTPAGEEPAYDRLLAGFNLRRESLDDLLNPAAGIALSWSIEYAHRRYSDDNPNSTAQRQAVSDTRTRLSADWYRRVRRNLVIHVGVNYAGLETSESLPPVSELIFVGGPGTVRGFRNEQFAALRTACGTFEPRYRFEEGHLFLFYDGAWISNRRRDGESVVSEELYRYGYGLGLAIHDRQRAVKLSVGWNREAAFDQPRLSVEFSTDI